MSTRERRAIGSASLWLSANDVRSRGTERRLHPLSVRRQPLNKRTTRRARTILTERQEGEGVVGSHIKRGPITGLRLVTDASVENPQPTALT